MALRIGFKIHRFLGQSKLKFHLTAPSRTYGSRPKYVVHPVRCLKSSSHAAFAPRKYASARPMTAAYRDRDLQVAEYDMDAFENDLQPAAMPEYFTSTLESNLANFPEKSDLVRGRFAKSSTQSALTVPLKLPRLANPFPERLKSFPSDTTADDEKAKLMEEEMKMVARYHLQQSQEAAAYEPEPAYQPPAALQYHEDAVGWRESADSHPEDHVEAALTRSRRPQTRPRSRTRAARYLKTSRHASASQQPQQRRFSSVVCSSPLALSDLEQCDVILDRLRAQYPEYRALKKPLFVPGSREERAFIETTLRRIAKHKHDDAVVKRAAAPFPSYSEVKTFVREPRAARELKVSASREHHVVLARSYSTATAARDPSAVQVLSETRPDSDRAVQELVTQAQLLDAPRNEENPVRSSTNSTWRTAWSSRSFSTRTDMCKKDKKKEKATCKTMKSPGCADPNPNKCEYVYEKTTCKKLEAPYPSYSECMGDQYEEEPSECKICPWEIPSRHARKTSAASEDSASSGKKKYSTFTAASAAPGGEKLATSKNPPCKNPFSDKKPCDFERAAQKQDEKRRKRPNLPSSKPQPASKKSFSTLATTASQHALHTYPSGSRLPLASAQYSTQHAPAADNKTIVDRIRGWLNSWRPGSDNIRITQSADLSAGRETYIIEIQDVVAEQPRPETAPWISSESLRPATVHHVGPQAGYACADKVSSGCPPPKKKEQVSEDKKKCRQRKKRKLPSCNDVGKDKPKKDARNYAASIQINEDDHQRATNSSDQLSQKTQEINALQETKVPGGQFENVPFKLKPQFWRV